MTGLKLEGKKAPSLKSDNLNVKHVYFVFVSVTVSADLFFISRRQKVVRCCKGHARIVVGVQTRYPTLIASAYCSATQRRESWLWMAAFISDKTKNTIKIHKRTAKHLFTVI